MSLLLLIDGYNVVAPVAAPSRNCDPSWLHRERMLLVDRLVQHLPENVCRRTCVVFDAANPPRDRPSRFEVEGIDVCFAVGYAEADDLLEELIAQHSAPKNLAVVSSDQRVQTAARRRGSLPMDSQAWLDELLDGVVRLAVEHKNRSGAGQGGAGQGGAGQGGAGQGGAGQGGAGQGSGDRSGEKPTPDDDDTESWLREFGF